MSTLTERNAGTPDKQRVVADAIRYTTEALAHCVDWKRRAVTPELSWPFYCDHTNLKRVQSDRFARNAPDLHVPQALIDEATRLLVEWDRLKNDLGMIEPRTEKDQEDFTRRANQHAAVYVQFYTQLEAFERTLLEFFTQHAD